MYIQIQRSRTVGKNLFEALKQPVQDSLLDAELS